MKSERREREREKEKERERENGKMQTRKGDLDQWIPMVKDGKSTTSMTSH